MKCYTGTEFFFSFFKLLRVKTAFIIIYFRRVKKFNIFKSGCYSEVKKKSECVRYLHALFLLLSQRAEKAGLENSKLLWQFDVQPKKENLKL